MLLRKHFLQTRIQEREKTGFQVPSIYVVSMDFAALYRIIQLINMCDTCFLSIREVILRYYSPLERLEISKVNWGKVNGSLPERYNNLAFGFLPSVSIDLPSLCWAWARIWPSFQTLLPFIILHPSLTDLVYFMPLELSGSLLVFDCMLQLHVVILHCAGTPKQFSSRYALQLGQCYARGLIFESCEEPCTPCCKTAGRTSMMC